MPHEATLGQATSCVNQSFQCFRAVEWISAIDWVYEVDWYEELRLIATATLMTAIIFTPIILVSKRYAFDGTFSDPALWAILPRWIQEISPGVPSRDPKRRTITCVPHRRYSNTTRRIKLSSDCISVYGWPSRGGVIILDHAERVDLEFLSLDPFNLPAERLHDQKEEDTFCQRLLFLGAKWWDSKARSHFLAALEEPDTQAVKAVENYEAAPTIRERRWVSVAWPSTGGLWVAEFDAVPWEIAESDDLVPDYISMLKLAHTMDERSQILRDHFEAKFFQDLKDYQGYAFLNAWEEKATGEVGPLTPLKPMTSEVQCVSV